MNPIVAIVGRPNVGKSTLFNRIIGAKKAIIANEPGVTRDRNYSDVKWGSRSFTLIDTGGFEPTTKDPIFIQMREQCQLAMDEADLILFIMDGKEGLVHSDREIVDILRRLTKPVLFIVNKIDGPKHEERVYEFYGLGVDKIHSISAEHRYGIDELMEEVIKRLPNLEENKWPEDVIKIAVVGRPNVGKSSLINRILGYKRLIVNEAPGTTRDAIDTFFKQDGKEYLLIDTAGIRRKSRIGLRLEKYSIVEALRAIDRCNVALLLLDPKEGVTDQDAHIGGFIHEKGRGCILVVNKWDLIEKDSNTSVKYRNLIYDNMKFLSYVPILFVSALTGQRVNKILEVASHVSAEAKKRISTAELNRYLEKWIEASHPPSYRGHHVKLNYITEVSTSPPTFVIYTNFPEGIHFSYERYLINQMRKVFGFEGVPIRLIFRKKGRKKRDG